MHSRLVVGLTALVASVTLAACGAGSGNGDSGTLTVWTFEDVPARLEIQKQTFQTFTERSGVKVDLVPVEEDQFSQLLSSSAAAGELPDIVAGLPLAGVWEMHSAELLDTEATSQVMNKLGRGTFRNRALDLVTDDGTLLAIPSDAWVQLLIYRKDLFEKAGLPRPDTYATLLRAAKQLSGPGRAGITLATAPDDVFTQQSFEHLAMGNGCRLVDPSGRISLATPPCVEAFQLYSELASTYSVKGSQTVDSTRATYFAGKAAMVVWSSFLLDEMAGLRDDVRPTCGPCQQDPAYLAKNSGIVTALRGPNGQPAQFGEVVSWAITASSDTEASIDLVSYMMNDGYTDWLGMAPEGKIPTRTGTQQQPEKFVTAWKTLEAGVEDTKKPLGDIYSSSVMETLLASPQTIQRWGLGAGGTNHGALVGAMLGELPVPKALAASIDGEISPAGAAKQARQRVSSIQSSLD